MKPRLLTWLCCPACEGPLTLEASHQEGQEVVTGSLSCVACGRYPIVAGIPRMLASARHVQGPGQGSPDSFERAQTRTRRSFGFQWTHFASMYQAFEKNFLNYLAPLTPECFRGRLVLDAGCGFGRHLYYAATYGAEVIGVDFSAAIESAARNTAHLPGVHLVQCDLYHLPFRKGICDLVYSIGVLHHLPQPEAGFRSILQLVKPEGAVAIWVYSSARRGINTCLEMVRRITTRLPLRVLQGLSWVAALIDWCGCIVPYRMLHTWPMTRNWIERHAWPRIKLYACYPLEVCVADWFDRLAAPIRFYYDPEELHRWCARASLTDVQVSATGRYGWRVYGKHSVAQAQHVFADGVPS